MTDSPATAKSRVPSGSNTKVFVAYAVAVAGWSLVSDLFIRPRWFFWLPLIALSTWAFRTVKLPRTRDIVVLTVISLVMISALGNVSNTAWQRHLGYYTAPYGIDSGWQVAAAIGLAGCGYAALLLSGVTPRSDLGQHLRTGLQGSLLPAALRVVVLVFAVITLGRCFTGDFGHFDKYQTLSYSYGTARGKYIAPAVRSTGQDSRSACALDFQTVDNSHLSEPDFVDGCVEAIGG